MLKSIGDAMKKMAQRSMMRGNRGDAQAITNFGVEGMRSNLHEAPQNVITQHVNIPTGVPDVFVKETTDNVKSNIANANMHHVKPAPSQPAKKLGNSVLDALQ